jgi:hypothetical protein
MDRDAAVEAAVEIAGAAFQAAGRAAAVFASSAWHSFNAAYDLFRDYVQSATMEPVEGSCAALEDGWEDI